MAEIRCAECGRRYETKGGLRRHVKSVHGGAVTAAERPGLFDTPAAPSTRGFSFDTPATRATQDAAATQDARANQDDQAKVEPRGARGQVLDRALRALGIRREDVMAFKIYDDRVAVIEGPVGYKRTWVFPGGEE